MTRWYKRTDTPGGFTFTADDIDASDDTDASLTRQQRYRKRHPGYVQREQQQRADKRASGRKVKPFASVDGEGAPARADRSYVLLRAGDSYLAEPEPQSLKLPSGLTWDQCLDWICHLPKDREYVAFAFDYDVTTILCGYSIYDRGWRTLKRLTEQTIDKPVLFHRDDIGWWVWYRPRMEFKVAPARRCQRSVNGQSPTGWCSTTKPCDKCKQPADFTRGHMTRISDTIKLFQSTLVRVIGDWQPGTPGEREKIRIGKDKREDVAFTDPAERAEVIEYNGLETKLHAEVMEEFRQAWHDAGLPYPRNWQSPGSLAKILLQHYRVPKRKEIDALEECAQ